MHFLAAAFFALAFTTFCASRWESRLQVIMLTAQCGALFFICLRLPALGYFLQDRLPIAV